MPSQTSTSSSTWRGNDHVTELRTQFESMGTTERPGTPTPESTPSPRRTVLTGDGRTPLRERWAAAKARLHSSYNKSSPATPLPNLGVAHTPEPPAALRSPRAPKDIRARLSAERLNASYCDDEDIALDRWANQLEKRAKIGKAPNPLLPLSARPRRKSRSPLRNSVKRSDLVAQLEACGPEMKRLLDTYESGSSSDDGSGSEDGKSSSRTRLARSYVTGAVDGAPADRYPRFIPVPKENGKRTGRDGDLEMSLDETMASLYGAIDQELRGWSSSPTAAIKRRLTVVKESGSEVV
ncbi:hypothetical protein SCAR479_04283 [Seiridium cardinale]|uniref:Uncharacterized protein n=1 Tax=Seiridium cardinale TaxID=138064 RepID=A0ABR2XYN1_9PEZI